MVDALSAVEDGKADGVGVVLGDGLVGVNLDHVHDPESGSITPDASAIITSLDSYTELSPSQTGAHILARGTLPSHGQKNWIEVYATGRYSQVTGWHIARHADRAS